MNINITNLDREVRTEVIELSLELNLFFDDNGIKIEAERAQESSAEAKDGILKILYKEKAHFFRLLRLYVQNCDTMTFKASIDTSIKNIGLMGDCSRNAVYKVDTVKKLIRKMALMGYTYLELYTEDTYEVKNEPYFGYMRGRYTACEIKEIDAYAKRFGIELIPCIQALAHLNQIFRWIPYHGVQDCGDILLAQEDRTYELLENIFLSLAESFSSRKVNIGMDEAHMVGLGKYLDKYGYKDRFEIINTHIAKVQKIADKYGFKLSMWSDMYFRLAFQGEYYTDRAIDEAVLSKVPKDLELIYWDYYSTLTDKYRKMIDSHLKFGNEIAFAGGAWKWMGFTPDNRYSMAIAKSALLAVKESNVSNVLLTCWGDNGAEASIFSVLPSMLNFADIAYDGRSDLDGGMKVLAGCDAQTFLCVDLPNRLSDSDNVKEINNSSRYLLYNDYFMGVFDSAITDDCESIYASNIIKLDNAMSKMSEFGYLIATQKALLEVIKVKYNLGNMTRTAYKQNDKKRLETLAKEDYTKVYQLIEKFYEAFDRQWHLENKANGFDVQDLRLGGLLQRTKACKQRLLDYCEGKIEKIEELEERLLDFAGQNDNFSKPKDMIYISWMLNSSVNII